jgi:hypothetical protein
MKYLFETLFRKYESFLQNAERFIYPNSDIEISFEFAEYFYNKYLINCSDILDQNMNFWQSISITTAYTEEFIDNNIDRPWDWFWISKRKNLSKQFVSNHYEEFLGNDIYENFRKHSKKLYYFFYETYIEPDISSIDDVLEKCKNVDDYLLSYIFTFEDYDVKYYPLIKHIRFDYYYEKFGKKSLKRFIEKYINYIHPKWFSFLTISSRKKPKTFHVIDKFLIMYGSPEQLKNSQLFHLTKKIYEKYGDKFPSNFRMSLIRDLTLHDIMSKYFDKMYIEDYDYYTEYHLKESELEYLIDNNLFFINWSEKNNNKYYLNWGKLMINKNISRGFIDKHKNDKRYSWENIEQMYQRSQFYTMEEYKEDPSIDLNLVNKIDAEFLKEHIDFYSVNFNKQMAEKLNDDIAQILIDNNFDVGEIFYDQTTNLSIEFVWKHKDAFINSYYGYVYIPKTNEEAIKYFPFCENFDNVDIFNAGSNDLVYIFNKWISVEKVLDLLDQPDFEIIQLPRDILTTILEMLTFE